VLAPIMDLFNHHANPHVQVDVRCPSVRLQLRAFAVRVAAVWVVASMHVKCFLMS
jgi:hypothetical protein